MLSPSEESRGVPSAIQQLFLTWRQPIPTQQTYQTSWELRVGQQWTKCTPTCTRTCTYCKSATNTGCQKTSVSNPAQLHVSIIDGYSHVFTSTHTCRNQKKYDTLNAWVNQEKDSCVKNVPLSQPQIVQNHLQRKFREMYSTQPSVPKYMYQQRRAREKEKRMHTLNVIQTRTQPKPTHSQRPQGWIYGELTELWPYHIPM